MATNYKLGLLTAAVLAACSAEESKDHTAPTIDLNVYLISQELGGGINAKDYLISGPTYHPSLGVQTRDYGDNLAEEDHFPRNYVLPSDDLVKPHETKSSSNLREIILYENGKPVITRRDNPENKMYGTDYFSADLKQTDGEYTYQVKAVDNAGNSTESSLLTLVFKNGYAYPKEEMMKDTTPPKVTFDGDWERSTLYAEISEREPNCTGIFEATLFDGTKVIDHYAAKPENDGRVLRNNLSSKGGIHFFLTNLPHGTSKLLGVSIPTSETLAAVKNVVVVAKDFAGNEVKIIYSETEDFKKLSEIVKDYQEIK